MNNTDKQTIAQALHKLVALIHELELESEYTELLGVAQVLEEAQTALEILNTEEK